MTRPQLLMSAQESVVAGLADEGIKVVFDTKTPYADLANRIMHLRPVPDFLESEDLEDLRGDCDHELGHFLFTDLTTLKAVRDPLEKVLFNAIEDGRVERLVADKWIGCAQNLEASGMRAVQEIVLKADTSEEWRQRRALIALQFLAYGHSMDHALWASGQDVKPLLDDLGDILDGIEDLPSSSAALLMARKIAKRWKKWAHGKGHSKAPKKKRRRSPKKGRKGSVEQRVEAFQKFNQPKREKAQKTRQKGDGELPSKFEGESPKGEDKSSSGEGKKSSDSPKTKQDEGPEPSQVQVVKLAESLEHGSVSQQRKKFIQEAKFESYESYLPYTREDKVEHVKPTKHGAKKAKRFDEALDKQVPILRRKLYMEFYSEVRRVRRHQRRGRLDERSLHKVGYNYDAIFRQRLPKQEVFAEAVLLVDWSGSMVGHEAFVAAQCAAAMSQVCDLLQIPNEVLAFTTDNLNSSVDRKAFSRITPLRHYVVKPRNKRYIECRGNFHTLAADSSFSHNNIDGEAVMWAAKRLVKNLEPGRKPILMVFSDGMPNGRFGDKTGVLQRHLRSVNERILKAGIALMGVGIESGYVERFYDHWVVVESIEELGTEFLGEFRKLLRKFAITR